MDIEVVLADLYADVHISSFLLSVFSDVNPQSAHANLQENGLVVSNLDDSLDVYSILNMQLMKNYSHGNTNDRIFKVAFVANGQLVSGGKGSCARVYDVQSGQLLQTLDHDKGELSLQFAFMVAASLNVQHFHVTTGHNFISYYFCKPHYQTTAQWYLGFVGSSMLTNFVSSVSLMHHFREPPLEYSR